MGTRPPRFRDRSDNRPFPNRTQAEIFSSRARQESRESPSFRNREERLDNRRKESPGRDFRSRNVPPEFRERKEPPDFRERRDRSRGRSRSRNRHSSPRNKERHSRSSGRRSRSSDRRNPRFEPPAQGAQAEFLAMLSASNDTHGRHSPAHGEQWVDDGPSRFSPPQTRFSEEFLHHGHSNMQFEMGQNFNPNSSGEMFDQSQLNEAGMSFGPKNFAGAQQNQPIQAMLNKQGFLVTNNPMVSQGFPQNIPATSGQSFLQQTPSSFANSTFQNFSSGNVEENPTEEVPLIPEFNPETCKLSAHEWVKLLDNSAKEYDWKKDEKQYIMASRLGGFARQWYLTVGINCKDFAELKTAFLKTFPTEMSFYSLLQKMLARVKEDNEVMAAYFHHKVALLNACEIHGRKAVSCIIGGLTSPKLRQQAKLKNCEDPDELYAYLRSCDPEPPFVPQKTQVEEVKTKNVKNMKNTKECYHCKAIGHLKFQCPQLKMHQCTDDNKDLKKPHNKVMHGSLSHKPTHPKYFLEVNINGINLKAYVDQTSECTTIRDDSASFLKLPVRKQYKVIRGFQGSSLSSVGVVDFPLCVDRAIANVKMFVVPDHLQAIPVIVGQSFTKQKHIVVTKDATSVRYFQRMDNGETNYDF